MNSTTEHAYLVEKLYQGFDNRPLWQRIAEVATQQEAEDCIERLREARGRGAVLLHEALPPREYRVVQASKTVLGEYTF